MLARLTASLQRLSVGSVCLDVLVFLFLEAAYPPVAVDDMTHASSAWDQRLALYEPESRVEAPAFRLVLPRTAGKAPLQEAAGYASGEDCRDSPCRLGTMVGNAILGFSAGHVAAAPWQYRHMPVPQRWEHSTCCWKPEEWD